ncbi:MAG: histidine triad nucleotide-binding protein [Acidimicrobiales bacterium]|nr:histidine triad nucleotide-binding protein [Acidimicrobiales bacterium]
MADDCLFCKIVAGTIPSTKVFENDDVFVFRDLNPVAPTHVLVIPKRHIVGADHVADGDGDVLAKMFVAAKAVADDEGIAETGYRTVFNVGADAGQTVPHLHLHVLGGRGMTWPPG